MESLFLFVEAVIYYLNEQTWCIRIWEANTSAKQFPVFLLGNQ